MRKAAPDDESRCRHPICSRPVRHGPLSEGLDLLQTQKDLGEFAQLVAGNDALQRVLTNPAIPVARKRGVIEELIASAPSGASRRRQTPADAR